MRKAPVGEGAFSRQNTAPGNKGRSMLEIREGAYMTAMVKRENPLRWAGSKLQILTDFYAWSMGVETDHLNLVKATHGEIPQELLQRAQNTWDRMGGIHLAAEAWMRGAE